MVAKLPPQNIQAEQSILGGLMLDPAAWDDIADIITSVDFYKPSHQKLYEVITDLNRKNQPIDIITITNSLTSSGELEAIGGADYLIQLLNNTVSAANISSYAKIVKEKSLLRKIIHTSNQIVEKSYNEEFENVETFLDQIEGDIFKIGETQQTSGLSSAMDIVKVSLSKIEELYNKKADVTGIASGFTELDKMTSGMHPGELTIIAARPSMGKTAFSLNIASHVVLRQKKTLAYFSLEMEKASLMNRMIASEARISMSDIRTGRISNEQWPKLITTASGISESHIFIDDTSGISPFEIRARCRRLKARYGLDVIMIDYLQLMDLKLKVESRERAVAEISKSLKSIAKELKVPVIALAQLNRGVESRADRRPMLSDLRESGSIEQDADVIMMLYRDDYYDKGDAEKFGNAEVIIGKQRNGATGTVPLRFEPQFNRFKDAEPQDRNNNYAQPQQQIATPPQGGGPMTPPGGKPRNFAPGANRS